MNPYNDADFIREFTSFVDDELVPNDKSATAELIKIKLRIKLKSLENKRNDMRLLRETNTVERFANNPTSQ